jgi:predicted deacylase
VTYVNQALIVGTLAATSKKNLWHVRVHGRAGLSRSLFLINSQQDGPTLVVTGGVHAAEYASIAAALDLGLRFNRTPCAVASSFCR